MAPFAQGLAAGIKVKVFGSDGELEHVEASQPVERPIHTRVAHCSFPECYRVKGSAR